MIVDYRKEYRCGNNSCRVWFGSIPHGYMNTTTHPAHSAPGPSNTEKGIIMTLVSSGVSTSPVDQHAEGSAPRRCWWTPRWLQRRREADELARWATEVA